jgi:hypothetical protein
MLTADIVIAKLRAGELFIAADVFCDEHGLAFITGASVRTVREWRRQRIGPQAISAARWLYDIETVAAWLNAGGFACEPVQEADGSMQSRAISDVDSGQHKRSNRATV